MFDERYLGKKEKRYIKILEILSSSSMSSIAGLARELQVSDETIRKDLKSDYLKDKVVQTHGSVALQNSVSGTGVPFHFRQELNTEAKENLARAACQLILPGNIVVIEHSTVGSLLIRAIAAQPELISTITLITNSFPIMSYLIEEELPVKTHFLGGRFIEGQLNTYGAATVAQMSELHGDISFLSPAAVSRDLLVTAFVEDDVQLKRCIVKNCRKNVLLMEESKYNRVAIQSIHSLWDYDCVITNVSLPEEKTLLLKEQKTEMIAL